MQLVLDVNEKILNTLSVLEMQTKQGKDELLGEFVEAFLQDVRDFADATDSLEKHGDGDSLDVSEMAQIYGVSL